MEGLAFLLLLSLTACVLSGAHVIELDEKLNDEKLYKHGGAWLVMFYAPWCGYCQKMKPAWEEVGKNLKTSGVHVARVDLAKYPTVGEHHKVEGMPTVKMFFDGEVFNYEGKRETQAIVDFVRRVTEPPVKNITNLPTLKGVDKSHQVFFTLSFTDGRSSQLRTRYIKAATKLRLTGNFYSTCSKEVIDKLGVKKLPSLVVFRDGQALEYSDKNVSQGAIEEWLASERYSLCPHLDADGIYDYVETKRPVVFGLIGKIRTSMEQKMADHVRFIAYGRKFAKDFYFATTDEVTLIRRLLLQFVSKPTLVVWDFQNKTFWLLPLNDDDNVSQEEVETFLTSIVSGSLAPSGGDSVFRRMYRMLWLMAEMVSDVYSTTPWVVVVSGIVLALCLIMCCTVMWDTDPEKEAVRRSAIQERDQLRRETPGGYYTGEKEKKAGVEVDEEEEDEAVEDDDAKEAKKSGKLKQS